MTKIFIEAKSNKTSEYHFLQAIISKFFPAIEVEFIFMDGIGNLYNETNLNQIKLAQETDEQVIVFADADTVTKGYGYVKRKKEIDNGIATNAVEFPYFIYPNNQDDGDVEMLMEAAALYAPNKIFFDCYTDYETCLKGAKDSNGESIYNVPSLKGKVYAYAAAQTIYDTQQRQRIPLSKKMGCGDWFFNDKNYWNLDVDALQPLKEFLAINLK